MPQELNSNEPLNRQGIEDIYRVDGPNLPIILYEGEIRVTNNIFDKVGQGQIYFSWHPIQEFNFDFKVYEPSEKFAKQMEIYLPQNGTRLSGSLSHVRMSMADNQIQSEYFGSLDAKTVVYEFVTSLATNDIQYIEFFIANLPEIHFLDKGTRQFEEGVPITFNEWQIRINRRFNWHDTKRELNESGGYGVTHICSIQKTDASMFSFNDVDSILHEVGLYLSYLRGEWSSILLPTGFSKDCVPLVKSWSLLGKTSPWNQLLTKYKSLNLGTDKAGLIPFLNLCKDPLWSNPIMSALRWYIECDSKSSGIEGSIIIQTATFELLGWMLFVQNPHTKESSNKEFSNMDLKRKVNRLLDWLSANKDINKFLYPHLYAFAIREGEVQNNPALYINEASFLLKKIRDAFVHPEASKQAFLSRISDAVMEDAHKLGQVYLKAILEKIFGYYPQIPNPKPEP